MQLLKHDQLLSIVGSSCIGKIITSLAFSLLVDPPKVRLEEHCFASCVRGQTIISWTGYTLAVQITSLIGSQSKS